MNYTQGREKERKTVATTVNMNSVEQHWKATAQHIETKEKEVKKNVIYLFIFQLK